MSKFLVNLLVFTYKNIFWLFFVVMTTQQKNVDAFISNVMLEIKHKAYLIVDVKNLLGFAVANLPEEGFIINK